MFLSLDYIYIPSADPATEASFFSESLGAQIDFAIEAFDTRVGMVTLGAGPPLLFAGHLDGERPILIYRVRDLDGVIAELRAAGCQVGGRFEIPPGPCAEIEAPGGHRIAIYQRTRPEVPERFSGRRDF